MSQVTEFENWQVIFRIFDTNSGEWIRNFTYDGLSEDDAKKIQKQCQDDVIKYQWNRSNYQVILEIELVEPSTKKSNLTDSTENMD